LRDFFIHLFPLRLCSVSGFIVYARDRSQLRLYQEIFVKDEFQIAQFKAKTNLQAPIVFDVGANCGYFSMRILDAYPSATVYAFEPQERLVREFEGVICENNLEERAFCHHYALGKQDGTALLYQNRSPISASTVQAKAAKRKIINRQSVTVRSLNSVLKEKMIEKIDILKIDVEGAEMDVLEGADQILSKVNFIIIETHKPFSDPEQVAGFLKKFDMERCLSLEKGNNIDLVFSRRNLSSVS
jgi:FkbM family methyltransferase